MNKKYLEYEGYCPESKLKGELIQLRLNDMDFWESEKTGLQLTIFSPYATILQWRGSGKFKASLDYASKNGNLFLLAKPQKTTSCEIFPDENNKFEDLADLEEFIKGLDKSYKEFDERRFKEKNFLYQ